MTKTTKKTEFRTHYELVSCKNNDTVWATLTEAIAMAKEIFDTLQPITGVEVRLQGVVYARVSE